MIREFQNEYRWLSNFSPVRIALEGKEYTSVEHAYMAAKCDTDEWRDFCADKNNSAARVKRESKKIELRHNWDILKYGVMKHCIRSKFSQEPYRYQLLATKNEYIQEGNRWNDKYWGVCLKTGEGQNLLGKLIMEIRDELR